MLLLLTGIQTLLHVGSGAAGKSPLPIQRGNGPFVRPYLEKTIA
jgi:hypothetical protein